MKILRTPVVAFIATLLLAAFPRSVGAATIVPGVDQLRMELLGRESATQVLTRRCAALGYASPAIVRAQRVMGAEELPSAETLKRLEVSSGKTVRFRRVRLTCGKRILSEAVNWYVPARLSAGMSDALDKTDTPFGTVVRPLGFHRQTVEATPLAGPKVVLRVRALLVTRAGQPFSLVVENYDRALLEAPVRH